MAFLFKKCYHIYGDDMNNKGFAVSSVLYTLLIAFLMFLGVLLAMFAASNDLVSNANIDLIDDIKLGAIQSGDGCVLKSGNDIVLKINSQYGIKSWPRDFTLNQTNNKYESGSVVIECVSENSICNRLTNIFNGTNTSDDITSLSLKVIDTNTNDIVSITVNNTCTSE